MPSSIGSVFAICAQKLKKIYSSYYILLFLHESKVRRQNLEACPHPPTSYFHIIFVFYSQRFCKEKKVWLRRLLTSNYYYSSIISKYRTLKSPQVLLSCTLIQTFFFICWYPGLLLATEHFGYLLRVNEDDTHTDISLLDSKYYRSVELIIPIHQNFIG